MILQLPHFLIKISLCYRLFTRMQSKKKSVELFLWCYLKYSNIEGVGTEIIPGLHGPAV